MEMRTRLPFIATLATSVESMFLNLIGLFSTTTFSAFAGLTVAGFHSAFLVAGSLVLWRRLVTQAANIP